MKRRLIAIVILLVMLPICAQAQQSYAYGAHGDGVTALQQRLIALGLLSGEPDGHYGPKTRTAVMQAQKALIYAGYDITENGIADAATLACLSDPVCEQALRTLLPGSTGPAVATLQQRLIDLGFLNGKADGDYGSKTQAAVQAFEQRMAEAGYDGFRGEGVATAALIDMLNSDELLRQYGLKSPLLFDDAHPLELTAEWLYCQSCILIDGPSGAVLFASEADTPLYPASTTKIMTLLLAVERGGLDEVVTIPKAAADVAVDSSLVPVTPGEEMRMRDLLCGLMIRSGNDAANAVAVLCEGSMDAFVQRMNDRAYELGMGSTHFCNPHGYHNADHMTTARDMATLTRYCLTRADFCSIAMCRSYLMPATDKRGELLIENGLDIFDTTSPLYIPGAAGVKSGYTSMAGHCYVGAIQKDGRTLIAALFGTPTRAAMQTDLRRLFNYGMALP